MSTQQPGTAETGAGGASGTVGTGGTAGTPPPNPSDTSHKVTVVNPSIKAAVWDHTKEGARLRDAYHGVHNTFQVQLPSIRQQLQHLQHRPIGG